MAVLLVLVVEVEVAAESVGAVSRSRAVRAGVSALRESMKRCKSPTFLLRHPNDDAIVFISTCTCAFGRSD